MSKIITNRYAQLIISVFALLLFVGCDSQRSQTDGAVADSGAVVDSAAVDLLSYPEVVMPPRIFTSQILDVARGALSKGTKHPFFTATRIGRSSRSSKWTDLPLETWDTIIADFAPVSLEEVKGTCPFCKKTFRGLKVNLATPLVGQTECCGETVYAEPTDMPTGYAIRPNHFETLTHLDGSSHVYSYFIPKGEEGTRSQWFCAEGELWRARLLQLELQVIPDLSARLIEDVEGTDVAAARTLAAIFTRMATVYPGLPFYNSTKADGFARDVEDPEQWYQAQLEAWWQPLEPYAGVINQKEVYSSKLFDASGYGGTGRFRHAGAFAEAYDLLRHHPAMDQISIEQFGSVDALDRLVMQGLFRHMGGWARQYDPFTGNMITVWFPAALKVAVLTGDEDYLRKIAFYYESYLRNHFWNDGLSIEAAFNYSAMLGYLFQDVWISEELMGIDFSKRIPLIKRIRELGDYPVVTLAGLESMHGDEHAAFFASMRLDAARETLDYTVPSQNFPSYGLACLRAGAPGARMEFLMDYQNVTLHAHPAGLNLQLFYQGVNLLPDVGYDTRNGKLGDARFKSLDYPFELMESPAFAKDVVEGHNTGTALGNQFGHNSLCFERYSGKPGNPLQMVQVEGKWIYDTGKWPTGVEIPEVSIFNRQIAALTLPNGRALGMDFFRMQGGWRHDVYWHAPAGRTECNLTDSSKINAPSLLEYYQANATPRPGWMKEATYNYHYKTNVRKVPYFEGLGLFENPVEWRLKAAPWKINWQIDPSRYAPITAAGWSRYEPWDRWLRPVNLNLWGHALGDGVSENKLFGATAPWAGNLEMGTLSSSGRMAFKDGFQAVVAHRQGSDADAIRSTFVHLLDPATQGQGATLSSMKVVDAIGDDGQMGAIIGAQTAEGDRLFVASSLAGGMIVDERRVISTDARLAVVMPELAMLSLFDGREVKTSAGAGIEVEAMPALRLIEVRGDLTGQPLESALIVESSSAALPVGSILSGLTLTVEHQTSEAHATGYEIEDVVALSENRYRINLRNNPPFIERLVRVTSVQEGASSSLNTSHHLHDGLGRPYGLNRLLWLPRSGFRSTLKSQRVNGYAGWHSETLVPADRLADGEALVGDALVIYKIQPGDRVIIPEMVSCRPVSVEEDSVICEVFSTGVGNLIFEQQSYPIVVGEQIVKIKPSKENHMKIQKALAAAAALSSAALNVVAQTQEIPALEAHYAFEGRAADRAKDSTGRHPDAFVKKVGSVDRVLGQTGNGLQLNGGSLVSIWKEKLALQPGKAVSLWVKPEASLENPDHEYSLGLLASKVEKCYDGFVTLGRDKKLKVDILVLEDDQGNSLRFKLPAIEIGTWYQLALSVDSTGSVTAYVDGKSVGTQASKSGEDFKLTISMIGRGYSGGVPFDGVLDEVKFYNTEIGPAQ